MHLEMFSFEALETLYSCLSSINMLTNPPRGFCAHFNQPSEYTGETVCESVWIFCLLRLVKFISWCTDAKDF